MAPFNQPIDEELCRKLRITRGRPLGVGSFAVVLRATWDGQPVALKVLLPQHANRMSDLAPPSCPARMLRREGEALLRHPHRHLLRCYALLDLPPDFPGMLPSYTRSAPALVLELMEEGSLSGLLRKQLQAPWKFLYDNATALEWAVQVAAALSYLHGLSPAVIHRDVKLDNVMLTCRGLAGEDADADADADTEGGGEGQDSCRTAASAASGSGRSGGPRLVAKLGDLGLHTIPGELEHCRQERLVRAATSATSNFSCVSMPPQRTESEAGGEGEPTVAAAAVAAAAAAAAAASTPGIDTALSSHRLQLGPSTDVVLRDGGSSCAVSGSSIFLVSSISRQTSGRCLSQMASSGGGGGGGSAASGPSSSPSRSPAPLVPTTQRQRQRPGSPVPAGWHEAAASATPCSSSSSLAAAARRADEASSYARPCSLTTDGVEERRSLERSLLSRTCTAATASDCASTWADGSTTPFAAMSRPSGLSINCNSGRHGSGLPSGMSLSMSPPSPRQQPAKDGACKVLITAVEVVQGQLAAPAGSVLAAAAAPHAFSTAAADGAVTSAAAPPPPLLAAVYTPLALSPSRGPSPLPDSFFSGLPDNSSSTTVAMDVSCTLPEAEQDRTRAVAAAGRCNGGGGGDGGGGAAPSHVRSRRHTPHQSTAPSGNVIVLPTANKRRSWGHNHVEDEPSFRPYQRCGVGDGGGDAPAAMAVGAASGGGVALSGHTSNAVSASDVPVTGAGSGTSDPANANRPTGQAADGEHSSPFSFPSAAAFATEDIPPASPFPRLQFNGLTYESVYRLTGATGSYITMAPEVQMKLPYNEKADVFSFGVILYELFSRSLLLVSHLGTRRPGLTHVLSRADQYAAVVAKGFRPSRVSAIPDPVWDIITACWQHEPLARPTMTEVERRLRDLRRAVRSMDPAAAGGGKGSGSAAVAAGAAAAAADSGHVGWYSRSSSAAASTKCTGCVIC